MSSANTRVAQSPAADLAYFIQEKGLCEEFVRWCDEMPPVERLLAKKSEAREVLSLLNEGHRRGYGAAEVAAKLDEFEKRADEVTG